MKIGFCNSHAYPCGCRMTFRSGRGEYSDATYIDLCDKHSPETSPDTDAKDAGYVMTAAGTWVLTPNVMVSGAGTASAVALAVGQAAPPERKPA